MNADHVGREVTEAALGQDWTFSRWTRAVHQAYSEWAQNMLPDPIERVTRSLDKVALKDAAIIRQLQIDDLAETKKAKEENRPAILMAPQYTPFADVMTKQAINKAGCYTGFGSPEIASLINSPEGTSYLFYLLLKPKHKDITPDQAYDVMLALNQREEGLSRKVIDTVSGKLDAPPKNEPAQAA